MLNADHEILAELAIVDNERRRRAADPALARCVQTLKVYQQRRFSHTYSDLLSDKRYSPAARFFLDELYGPSDFARRDAQFARVVPALVRLFPHQIVRTVATLAQLHALSETLDTEMAHHFLAAGGNGSIDAERYVAAWQATGRPDDRERQIALTLEVAATLDSLTRKTMIRNSLRLMRGPARAAGLTELQCFLEAGFDTFRSMRGAAEFIRTVDERERLLARTLFGGNGNAGSAASLLPEPAIDEVRQ